MQAAVVLLVGEMRIERLRVEHDRRFRIPRRQHRFLERHVEGRAFAGPVVAVVSYGNDSALGLSSFILRLSLSTNHDCDAIAPAVPSSKCSS